MDYVGRFLSLAQQVCFWVIHYWQISLVLAVVWVWAFAACESPPHGGRRRIFVRGCLPPFAFPLAILIVGVVFARVLDSEEKAPIYPHYIIATLLLIQLPLAGLACWLWHERWRPVATSWVCGGCLSLAAGINAGMAVTGTWL